jgi:hypothetical protein
LTYELKFDFVSDFLVAAADYLRGRQCETGASAALPSTAAARTTSGVSCRTL